jgi:adenylate kinase
MKRHPIVFLVGLSGVGKTTVAGWLESDLSFVHLNIDRDDGHDGIAMSGLRVEWNTFLRTLDAKILAVAIRKQTNDCEAR